MKMMLSLLMTILLIFIGCSSKENSENISNGTVVDENTIADGDSLAQILQTWVPEIAVDSVKHLDIAGFYEDSLGNAWYETVFSSNPQKIVESYSDDGLNTCFVHLFEKEIGAFLHVSGTNETLEKKVYLRRDSVNPVAVFKYDYGCMGNSDQCSDKDSIYDEFRRDCFERNGVFRDYYVRSQRMEIHSSCEYVVTPLIDSREYLSVVVEKMMESCR